jgi:hypothetical protein
MMISEVLSESAHENLTPELEETNLGNETLKIGTRHQMNTSDIDRCIRIGQGRNHANILGKRKNMRYSRRDDTQISIQGCIGELALMRMLGLQTTELDDVTCRNASNDTFDATINGNKIDAKTTIRSGLDLVVSTWKSKNPPELYALLTLHRLDKKGTQKIKPSEPFTEDMKIEVEFCGMVKSEHVLKRENIQTRYGNKEYYIYPSKKLMSYPEVLSEEPPQLVEEPQDANDGCFF